MRTGVLTIAAVMMATAAHAHVTITPRESKAGATEKYTLRVPTEGKVATQSLELTIPEGVTVTEVAAPEGATYDVKKQGDRIVGITWKVEIEPGKAAQLSFTAKNPTEGTQLLWKAKQIYSDGTSSNWAGAPGEQPPAPLTKLLPAGPSQK
jgi:uncharacterized protein YcnI